MIIVELALQGVGGQQSTQRVRYGPGLNAASIAAPDDRVRLVDLIFHTLFPDPGRGDATQRWASGDPARVALSFYGRDEKTYRLIRELRAGSTRLSRYDPEKKSYERLSRDSAEAAQYVRVQQRLPDELSFERLFVLHPRGLPSALGAAMPLSGGPIALGAGLSGDLGAGFSGDLGGSLAGPPGAPLGGEGFGAGLPPSALADAEAELGPAAEQEDNLLGIGMPPGVLATGDLGASADLMRSSSAAGFGGADMGQGLQANLTGSLTATSSPLAEPEDPKLELARLKAELHDRQKFERAFATIDEVRARRDREKAQVQRLSLARRQVTSLKKAIQADASLLKELPEDIEARLERFEGVHRAHEEEGRRWAEEEHHLRPPPEPKPLSADPFFIGGAALGVGSLGLAIGMGWPWAALLNIPGAVVAGAAALHWVSQGEEQAQFQWERRGAEERHKRSVDRYHADTAVVRRLLVDSGLSPTELRRRIAQLNERRAGLAEAEAALKRALAEPGAAEVEAALEATEAELSELDDCIHSSDPGGVSVKVIEARIEALEELIAKGPLEPPTVEADLTVEEDTPIEDQLGAAIGQLDAAPEPPRGAPSPLLSAALDLLQIEAEQLFEKTGARLGRYLEAFTEGQVRDPSLGRQGSLLVDFAGARLPVEQLPAAERDWAHLALQLGLVDAVVRRFAVPLIVDDPFPDAPPARREVLKKTLAFIGNHTQVLFVRGEGASAAAKPEPDPLPTSGPVTADPMLGRVLLDRYKLLRRIGSGGMGAVYLADQTAVGRKVAVKLLHPELLANEEVRRRFQREAQLIAKLSHPNTIQLFDYGTTEDGFSVMVMELLEGLSLAERLKTRGAMPLLDVVRLGQELAGSLREAHKAGLVHRDLKPANIFLAQLGGVVRAKVLDFGIARLLDEGKTRLTVDDQVFGTPRYMAPEQALSPSEVDGRADIYSLGLILYECVVGASVFRAGSPVEYLQAHLSKPAPKLRDQAPEAPVALEVLIDACLQKDPADRPQSADEVGAVLHRVEVQLNAAERR